MTCNNFEFKKCKVVLDVDVSPPANIMTFRPGVTHLAFDHDKCDIWPWLMTLDLEHHLWDGQMRSEITFLTWWPWPWPSRSTFDLDPCDFWTWPMWPLTSKITCKVVEWDLKCFFDLVTLTFDLWPWPSRSTLGSSTSMCWPNLVILCTVVFEIWINVQWINV